MAGQEVTKLNPSVDPILNFPFKRKADAKVYIANILAAEGLPEDIVCLAESLDTKIGTKGKPWDDLKQDILKLVQKVNEYQNRIKQYNVNQRLEIALPVIQDPRVNVLEYKMNQLEIMEKVKGDLLIDIKRVDNTIKSYSETNEHAVKDLRIQLDKKEENIRQLEKQIKTLTEEKRELEKKIISLENEIRDLRYEISENNRKTEMIIENSNKEIKTLIDESMATKREHKELEERHKLLEEKFQATEKENAQLRKSNEPKIIAGETAKLIIKAIYQKHVHIELKPRNRNSYNVADIKGHMRKYEDSTKKLQAQERYDQLKDKFNWDEDTEEVLGNLINMRNQCAHPIKPPTDKEQKILLRDALRALEANKDIDEDENDIMFTLYKEVKKIYPQDV